MIRLHALRRRAARIDPTVPEVRLGGFMKTLMHDVRYGARYE